MAIYLVQELWQDPMENHNAFGYEPKYVTTDANALHLMAIMEPKNGWPLLWDMPKYQVSEIAFVEKVTPQAVKDAVDATIGTGKEAT